MIFVATDAEWVIVVPGVHDLPDAALRHPGGAGVVVEIGDVPGGLVAMRVHADEAGHIGELAKEFSFVGVRGKSLKERVQLGNGLAVAAHEVD